ncbi:hypothetical protein [Streptomyces sp. H27-D2]|uniref:hypothetical protein n=1 Tax=Streptomyces sp. H27-D2 TaxID=3046304 RepID=UPI002DBC35DF|nr:hypothetical protein [Streptomyces sp. H27-D2]MEC4016067.1 hypothetical protein [Streptomyces sp. H27-D2]
MDATLDTAVADLVDALDAISDPQKRYQASRETETAVAAGIRGVRQRIAVELKTGGLKWREVGEIMGNVSAQRAFQISRSE